VPTSASVDEEVVGSALHSTETRKEVGVRDMRGAKETKDIESSRSHQQMLRKTVYAQAGLLLCDILVALPLLLVVLTCYRAKHLRGQFSYDSFNHHKAILWNALVVLHDIVFLPIGLLLLLSLYRARPVISMAFAPLFHKVCGSKSADKSRDSEEGGETENGAEDAHTLDSNESSWLAMNQELIATDSRWADLVDWRRAPTQYWEGLNVQTSRWDCWKAAGSLCLDLPFLMLGLVVLCSCWRGPKLVSEVRICRTACEGRRASVKQLILTFRDLLVLPVFLLLLPSPYVVGLISKLRARLNKPLEDNPILHVKHVQVTVPEHGSISMVISAELARAFDTISPGSMKLQLLGNGFWRSVEKGFGSTVASVAQGLLPLKIPARSTEAYEPLSQVARTTAQTVEFTIALPMKSKRSMALKNLPKLGSDGVLLVQIEAREKSGRKLVIATVPLKLEQLLPIVAAGSGELAGESLTDEDLVRQCRDTVHKGLVDSFWLICCMQGFQLLLDILHFSLALTTILAPWRFVALLVCLCEPKARWPGRVCNKAADVAGQLRSNLQELRGELVGRCNATAKDGAAAHAWCANGKPPQKLQKFHSEKLVEHQQLARLMQSLSKMLPEDVAKSVKTWLEMQDACLYYAVLRCYVHSMLVSKCLPVEEHGLMIHEIGDAESSLQQAAVKIWADFGTEVELCKTEAPKGCRKSGCWRKDTKLMRKIVRSFAFSAALDIVGLCLLLLMCCTVYRVPWLVTDLCRHGACNPSNLLFKRILVRHVKATGREMFLMIQVFLLLVLVAITVVRLPYALNDALVEHHCLESLRKMLWKQLQEVLNSLWELLCLLTVVKHYKLLLKAVLQCCLVPPACLSEFVGRLCSCLPLGCRFMLSLLMFYSLVLMLPAVQWWFQDSANMPQVRNAFLGSLGCLLLCNVASVCTRAKYYALPSEDVDWVPATMRATWNNIFSVLAVIGQPCILCMLLIGRHWVTDLYSGVCAYADTLSLAGLGIASLWLLVVSLIFVPGHKKAKNNLQASPMFRSLQLFLSQVCFLPVVLCLLAPSLTCQGATLLSWAECRSLIALCVYMITTQMLSSDGGVLDCLPMQCGVDVRYAPVFLMVTQLLDLSLIASPLALASDRTQLFISAACAGTSFLWTCTYWCLRGSFACCVPHITALRAGGSLAVTWVSVLLLMAPSPNSMVLLSGLVLCVLGSVVAAAVVRWSDRARRQRIFEASGIIEVVSSLAEAQEALCVKDAVLGGWAEPQRKEHWQRELQQAHTAKSLARCLLDFENHVLAERLSDEFLACRLDWRADVQRVSSFPDLLQLTIRLRHSLRLPSSLPRLRHLSAQLLGRWDLSLQMLDFVVGHEKLLNLFQAALFARTSSKRKRFGSVDIALHCDRAKQALDTVLKEFEKFGWQRPATLVNRSSYVSYSAAPWKMLEVDGATLYSPTGQSFTEEPAAIREEYAKVPIAPQKKVPIAPPQKKDKPLALGKKELAKGEKDLAKSTEAERLGERLGTYEILAATRVRAALSIVSAPGAHLSKGALVTVLEVATLEEEGTQRTRALIKRPAGWITLLNLRTGKRFAQRQVDPQHINGTGADDAKIPRLGCDIDEGVTKSPDRTSLATQGRVTSKRVSFGGSVDLESGLDLVPDVQPTTYGAGADLRNGLGPLTEVERAEDSSLGRVNCTMVPQPLHQESGTEEPTGWDSDSSTKASL